MEDRYHAYMDKSLTMGPLGSGPLNGLAFAMKDVFAVQGHRNAAGNPDWLRTHEAATATAKAVELLLQGGAKLCGATHTDELMYSLNGENHHYGTPINPNAPGRIPGGSSSGSAAAVAAGEADFAIGTDTGGSVRIPSSYCGIYGFRPTHGAVDTAGLIPLAPSFDTVGWMAREAEDLLAVGKVLIGRNSPMKRFNRILHAEDIWSLAEADCREALQGSVANIAQYIGPVERLVLQEDGYSEWMNTFRMLQGLEIWRSHGEWIESCKPEFGPGIAERFAWTKTLDGSGQEAVLEEARERIRETMQQLLGDGSLLVMPTAPGPAPLLNLPSEQLEQTRMRTLQLCCIAGLAGLPQVTLPIGRVDGLPVGLSIIAGRGCDIPLLELVYELSERQAVGVSTGA